MDPKLGQSTIEMTVVPDVSIKQNNKLAPIAVADAVFTHGLEDEIKDFYDDHND